MEYQSVERKLHSELPKAYSNISLVSPVAQRVQSQFLTFPLISESIDRSNEIE